MRLTRIGCGWVWLLLVVGSASTGQAVGQAQEADPGTVILDQFSSWRMFHVLKPPEIAFDDGIRAVVYKEKENYLKYVKWYLPYTWRPELIGYAETKEIGALCYSFIYNDEVSFKSLTEYIKEKDLNNF